MAKATVPNTTALSVSEAAAAIVAPDQLRAQKPAPGRDRCRDRQGGSHSGDLPQLSPDHLEFRRIVAEIGAMAVYLEVGSRQPADVTTCSDVDMMSTNADGRFVHKDGTPYT